MASFDLNTNNDNENPFSPCMDSFLSRQLNLEGSVRTTSHFVETSNTFYESESIHVFPDHEGGNLIGYGGNYFFSAKDTEKRNQLNSYLLINLLTQSIENLETFLKHITNLLFEIHFKNKTIYKTLNKLRTNKERIDFITTVVAIDKDSQPIKTQLETYYWLEKIRHITVHSDQRISNDDVVLKNKLFTKYFAIKTSNGIVRLFSNSEAIKSLIVINSTFAYHLYFRLSQLYDYPVQLEKSFPF